MSGPAPIARTPVQVTFVSAPVEEASVVGGGRVSKTVIYVLQDTGNLLQLEYANNAEAMSAADDLTALPGTHFVSSFELFDAIRLALEIKAKSGNL